MKVLMVNKYGYPEYGSENYFLNLCCLLKDKGHKVITFTSKDGRNVDREYASYYVDKVDTGNFNSISLLNKISYAPKTIYSFEAKGKIERLIRDTSPDIIHIHNIKRLISPSILHSIKKFNIPVVYTLHEYHLICPNYRLFSNGKICELCKGNKYYRSIFKRCIKNSYPLSLLGCIEQYLHRAFGLFENIDMFIAPSRFLQNKMIDYGLEPAKITHIPHFIFADDYQTRKNPFDYIIYMGRLVREKGILTLIRAMEKLPFIKLLIIGDGEYRKELERIINKELKINNIEFKGYLPREDIKTIIKNAMFTIVPSEWFEVFGIVIFESFAMGKPVIGARIGGIPEVIDDTVNGFLFKPGDVNDLLGKIEYLSNNKNMALEMGESGRKKVLQVYSPQVHYERILKVYQNLLLKR